MKRNRLYTVNKWNKNLFVGGGQYSNAFLNSIAFNPHEDEVRGLAGFGNQQSVITDTVKKGIAMDGYNPGTMKQQIDGLTTSSSGSGGGQKSSVTVNPGLGAALSGVASTVENIGKSEENPNGLFDLADPVHHLAGGRQSGAGNAMGSIGTGVFKAGAMSGNPYIMAAGAALKVVGGLTNAAFGIKENTALKKAVDEGIKQNNNFTSNANSFDDIKGPQAVTTNTNVYEGGWFSGGTADEKNEALKNRMIAARSWANRSVENNVNNLVSDQLNDALANYAAYGGPLGFGTGALGLMQQNRYFDTIDKRSEAIAGKNGLNTAYTGGAKTFADGGLKAAFLDEFGSDPIGAAVRYNQGLEALAAQEEARKAEAAKEQEYLGMQQRLANLETENQGLQALMAAQQTPMPIVPEIPEETSVYSTPSKAASNGSTWDYIEDQLRRSGKFNDVQIEGIKYNLQRESSLDPTAVGDGGSAFGLGQWHGDRKPSDMSLEGQTQHLIDTLSNYDGRLHWIGRNNYEGFMNARTPEEAHYYITRGYERPRKDIVDKVKRYSDMSLRRLNAFGGELGTNGTDFTNGLLYVDEGGSHENNPLDGVPMGLDPQGIPNLVEEGETVYNDYVFSDRMKVPFFMYKELGLGGIMKKKGKEMSFADASKKLAQESEQRPNDPISQDGLQASLSRLAEVQEAERMKKNAKEYMGLEGYACGGKLGNKYWGENPNGQRMVIGMQVPKKGYMSAYKPSTFVAPWNTGFNLDFSGWLPQDAVLPNLDAQMQLYDIKTAEKDSGKKPQRHPRVQSKADTGTGGSNNEFGPALFDSEKAAQEVEKTRKKEDTPTIDEATRQKIAMDGYTPEIRPSDAQTVDAMTNGVGSRNGYDPYPTWMRYAPVVGAGVMSLTDLLGLTNNPDYTMANKLEAAANGAAYAPNIEYKPIGDYMRYTPLDRQFHTNQLMASSRATDRALANSSSPSRAAGLLANGYNTTLSLGNLARQAEEYNRAQYERTKDFNRKTNMFNSQMDLEAAMANARYRQQAQSLRLSGLGQAAALRDSIDARVGAAKSANLTNFLTSLGNIGRENFALNQINSDRSRQYGVYKNGVSDYKRNPTGKRKRKWYEIFG